MKYEFLQISDELLDAQAPVLARLLTAAKCRTSVGEAIHLVLRLERYVLRRVDDSLSDVPAEMRACAVLPRERAAYMLALATDWPEAKASILIGALTDPHVRVLEEVPAGWTVRGIDERYARFAEKRKASRKRARDNARARAAGWEPSTDKKTWVQLGTGKKFMSLRHLIAHLDGK